MEDDPASSLPPPPSSVSMETWMAVQTAIFPSNVMALLLIDRTSLYFKAGEQPWEGERRSSLHLIRTFKKSSKGLYLCVYIYLFLFIFIQFHWHSFTHSIICTFYSYVCHTQCSIKSNQENIDFFFFKAFLQCLLMISKCLPGKVVQEQLLS